MAEAGFRVAPPGGPLMRDVPYGAEQIRSPRTVHGESCFLVLGLSDSVVWDNAERSHSWSPLSALDYQSTLL